MKKTSTPSLPYFVFSMLFLAGSFCESKGQNSSSAVSLGSVQEFISGFSKINPSEKSIYTIKVSDTRVEAIQIETNTSGQGSYFVFGKVAGHEQATFFIKGNDQSLNGKLIFRKEKEAFGIYTNDLQEVLISPIEIEKVLCIEYRKYDEKIDGKYEFEEAETAKGENETSVMPPLLNSLPGGYGTLYLDFDGETVTGSSWGNITALPSSFTNANITTIWTAVSEDYSPFNVNVTTDIAVFNAATSTRRMKVIFTPTDDAAPGAGGVAFLNSWGSSEPCWVFNPSVKSAEEACSHETGHTVGLSHDGTPSQGYYPGHGSWGPIMGAVYTRPIVHFSKGEYASANNTEDDFVKISSRIPYRIDDHGSTIAAATILNADASGNVLAANNYGVIERRTDLDIFKFTAAAGNVNFTFAAKKDAGSASVPDLDIQARLLDAAGNQIVLADLANTLLPTDVTISQSVAAGTYYLEIDGVAGYGSPLNAGYTDYGSLGQFFISGNYPPGPTTGIADNANENGVTVFPNPSSGQFTIMSSLNGNCSFELLNSLGQTIMSESEFISGSLHKNINVPDLSSGVYCLVIKSGNETWQQKVLIK